MKSYIPRRARLATFALLCFCIFFSPAQSYAKDVFFSWVANPEPLIGYKLYYKIGNDKNPPYDGTGLAAGNSPIIIDKKTSYELIGLDDNKTYQFTITAYDVGESDFSTVLTVPADSSTWPTIINISVQ